MTRYVHQRILLTRNFKYPFQSLIVASRHVKVWREGVAARSEHFAAADSLPLTSTSLTAIVSVVVHGPLEETNVSPTLSRPRGGICHDPRLHRYRNQMKSDHAANFRHSPDLSFKFSFRFLSGFASTVARTQRQHLVCSARGLVAWFGNSDSGTTFNFGTFMTGS